MEGMLSGPGSQAPTSALAALNYSGRISSPSAAAMMTA